MRKTLLLVPALALGIAAACNSDSSNDGGTDATSEPPIDICSTFTGAGDTCLHASTIKCFESCDGGVYCACKTSGAGPQWVCVTSPECVNPCGNTSPLSDAGCDASDGSDGSTVDSSASDVTTADAPDGD